MLDVGGHTLGHVAFVFAEDNVAFVGDSLFAMGCGRKFEVRLRPRCLYLWMCYLRLWMCCLRLRTRSLHLWTQ